MSVAGGGGSSGGRGGVSSRIALAVIVLVYRAASVRSFGSFRGRARTSLRVVGVGVGAGGGADDGGGDCYDLAVVGGGPVGVRAALTAASPPLSRRVVLLDAPLASGVLTDASTNEDLSLGGPTGLFSKALRDVSKRVKVDTLRGMGLRDVSVWNEIASACVDLAATNARDVRRQLDLADVDVREGRARFLSSDDRAVSLLSSAEDDVGAVSVVRARNVLVATGSRPFRPPDVPFDGVRVFDSDSVNGLSYLPTSVVITGSGIIAIEYAKIFRRLGADVTLVIRDHSPRGALLKMGMDRDVAGIMVADLVRSGIRFERKAMVDSFVVPPLPASDRETRDPIRIKLVDCEGAPREGVGPGGAALATELRCDAYLAAVGREPNTSDLHLDSVGVDADDYGNVRVNGRLETSSPRVYAAGDVLGRPFLASTGVAQGVAAVEAMFGDNNEEENDDDDETECGAGISINLDLDDFDDLSKPGGELCIDGDLGRTGMRYDPASLASNPFAFPVGIWSSPEAAWYGLSLQQAEELGIPAREGIALYAECLRGQVFSPNGLLKIVFEAKDDAKEDDDDDDGDESQQKQRRRRRRRRPNAKRFADARILGVHICGDDACELIHYGMELVRAKRTLGDVVDNLYSAVTYHELYRIAAGAGLDQAAARRRRAGVGRALSARNRRAAAEGKHD